MQKKRANVGIDPGITGCAVLVAKDKIWFHDFESVYDAANTIARWNSEYKIEVLLEKVHSTPNDGHVGAFKFGMNYGMWQGILSAHRISYISVTPQKWKNAVHGRVRNYPGRDIKQESINRALHLFPQLKKFIYLKKHHGRAEALLMAYYLIMLGYKI